MDNKKRYYKLGTLSQSFNPLSKKTKCYKKDCDYHDPEERCCKADPQSQCYLVHLPGDAAELMLNSDGSLPHVEDTFRLMIGGKSILISGNQPKFFLKCFFQKNDDELEKEFQFAYNPTDNLTKLRNKLPPCLRGFCKNSDEKYHISATPLSYEEFHAVSPLYSGIMPHDEQEKGDNDVAGLRKGKFEDLVGDYFCCYYSAVNGVKGECPVLYALLRISSEGSKLSAKMILGLRENPKGQDRWNFDNFPKTYAVFSEIKDASGNSDVYYAEGNVEKFGQNGAVIHLKNMDNASEWHIYLDLTNYYVHRRNRNKDADHYQGGLGCVVSVHESDGVRMWMMGLMRNTCRQTEDVLSKPDNLKGFLDLKTLQDTDVALEIKKRDRIFYSWFISV